MRLFLEFIIFFLRVRYQHGTNVASQGHPATLWSFFLTNISNLVWRTKLTSNEGFSPLDPETSNLLNHPTQKRSHFLEEWMSPAQPTETADPSKQNPVHSLEMTRIMTSDLTSLKTFYIKWTDESFPEWIRRIWRAAMIRVISHHWSWCGSSIWNAHSVRDHSIVTSTHR